MSKDLDAIIQYIEQPNTDYAYMLNGAWGSGKTYFWKHVVVPRLRKVYPEDGVLIAYVSVYGVRKAEALRDAVMAQLHPGIAKAGKLVNTFGPAALKWLKVDVPESEGFLDWCKTFWKGEKETRSIAKCLMDRHGKGKRLIIGFDDLERASMPIQVLLGQINQFVEHAGAKVIILCNEDEIRAEDNDAYNGTKEKVVRITRTYSGSPAQVLSASIAEFGIDERYHSFLKKNHDQIAEILHRSGLRNLRALKYALLMLQIAHKELDSLLPSDDVTHTQLIRTLLPAAFDLQEGKIEDADAQSFLREGGRAIFGARFAKGTGKESPLIGFADRYGFSGSNDELFTSEAIAELVKTGYLDTLKLRDEIDARNAVASPGQQAVSTLLTGWWEMADEAVQPTVATALASVESGEIKSAERLHSLANALDWMRSDEVIAMTDAALRESFERGIREWYSNWPLADSDYFILRNAPHLEDHERPLGKFVREFIISTHEQVTDQKLKAEYVAALKALSVDAFQLANLLVDWQHKETGRRPIASFMTVDGFLDAFLGANNKARFEVAQAFRRRYSEDYINRNLEPDRVWLVKLEKGIEKHTEKSGNKGSISAMALRHLHTFVKQAIASLEALH